VAYKQDGLTLDGLWIAGYNRYLGFCSVFDAELWGILDGLTFKNSYDLTNYGAMRNQAYPQREKSSYGQSCKNGFRDSFNKYLLP
ncbi:hypothetical protein Goshw_029875, partial [Gossypium schwendimanii]|nr:hypothetical protein [Gossypium schwendimanii]